jgi:K+-sensing histidine kinase KdpD
MQRCPRNRQRLRELALRAVADEVTEKAPSYRARRDLSRHGFPNESWSV